MSEQSSLDAGDLIHRPAESSLPGPSTRPAVVSRRRRFQLLLLAAVAVIAITAVGIALLDSRDVGSPEHSLAQMTKAVRSGDWNRVQEYMDIDAVASSFVDATMATALEGDAPDALTGNVGGMGGGGNTPGSSGSGLAGTMKDTFIQQFRNSVKQSVEARGKTSTGEPSTLLLLEDPTSVELVSETEALATVSASTGDGTRDVVIRMVRAGDHWRIMALENFADLMSSVS